ncbi:hypothetical protein IQ07DRAFT_235876 [Pyrenochaeta sp. DS3sAY3a]|nr:hypothetical protein IQ07DRAFT_235876 [Pyrenochaeta sp. DS3sAY3a]
MWPHDDIDTTRMQYRYGHDVIRITYPNNKQYWYPKPPCVRPSISIHFPRRPNQRRKTPMRHSANICWRRLKKDTMKYYPIRVKLLFLLCKYYASSRREFVSQTQKATRHETRRAYAHRGLPIPRSEGMKPNPTQTKPANAYACPLSKTVLLVILSPIIFLRH